MLCLLCKALSSARITTAPFFLRMSFRSTPSMGRFGGEVPLYVEPGLFVRGLGGLSWVYQEDTAMCQLEAVTKERQMTPHMESRGRRDLYDGGQVLPALPGL